MGRDGRAMLNWGRHNAQCLPVRVYVERRLCPLCWAHVGLCWAYVLTIGTAIARMVADGCGRLGNVERRYPASWTLWDSLGYLDFPLPRAFFPWRCTGRCPTWLASSWEQPSPSWRCGDQNSDFALQYARGKTWKEMESNHHGWKNEEEQSETSSNFWSAKICWPWCRKTRLSLFIEFSVNICGHSRMGPRIPGLLEPL